MTWRARVCPHHDLAAQPQWVTPVTSAVCVIHAGRADAIAWTDTLARQERPDQRRNHPTTERSLRA